MTTSSIPAKKVQTVRALFEDDDENYVGRTLRQHGSEIARLTEMVRQHCATAEVIHPRAGQTASDAKNRLERALVAMEGAIDGDYVQFDATKLALKRELGNLCKELEGTSSPARHLASLLYDAVRWTKTSQVKTPMIEAIRECLGSVYAPWAESSFATSRRRLLRAGWLVSPPGDLEENSIS